ncbi:MAG: hypothetical protein MK008_11555 [Bdellovibrionales bacterium]|nr:hypothetical protein [Bdellovibrionales bacterium]
MILRTLLSAFLMLSLAACSIESNDVADKDVENEANQKLEEFKTMVNDLSDDGFYVTSSYYTNDLVKSYAMSNKQDSVNRLTGLVNLGREILAYEDKYENLYINGRYSIENAISNAEKYIEEINSGELEQKISRQLEREQKIQEGMNELERITQENNEADEKDQEKIAKENLKIQSLKGQIQDIESDFRELHQFYETSNTVEIFLHEHIVNQVDALTYKQKHKAKMELPKLVLKTKNLRQKISELPTEMSEYERTFNWVENFNLKDEISQLESLINGFEQKLNQSLWKQERASLGPDKDAA